MFRRSTSLAIPHRKSFAAIPSLSLGSLGTRIAASNCHTNCSVNLPLFRHFQDQSLTTNKETWGKKTGLCWAVIWGGAKRNAMGGGKRTRERALPKIFEPLQKSFWSALSWVFVQEKQSTDTWGGWKTYRMRAVQNPFFGRGVIRDVLLSPLFFHPPMASSACVGRCPSTVWPVFSMLVFQL